MRTRKPRKERAVNQKVILTKLSTPCGGGTLGTTLLQAQRRVLPVSTTACSQENQAMALTLRGGTA